MNSRVTTSSGSGRPSQSSQLVKHPRRTVIPADQLDACLEARELLRRTVGAAPFFDPPSQKTEWRDSRSRAR